MTLRMPNWFCRTPKVAKSSKETRGFDDIVGRELAMMNGSTVTEKLFSVDKEKYRLPYDVVYADEGMKAMMGPWKCTWVVEPISDSQCTMVRYDETKLSYWPPYFLMSWPLKIMFKPIVLGMMNDVKYFAVTGEPIPAKVEALKKVADENATATKQSS